MINPSTSGWIDKFFAEQKFSKEAVSTDIAVFYQKVRNTGFIYGHIISFDTSKPIETKGWFKEEISKIALGNNYNLETLLNAKINNSLIKDELVKNGVNKDVIIEGGK